MRLWPVATVVRSLMAAISLCFVPGARSTDAAIVEQLVPLPRQSACISETGDNGLCEQGTALAGVAAVALSPDGRHAYAVADESNALLMFDRDPVSSEPPGEWGQFAVPARP